MCALQYSARTRSRWTAPSSSSRGRWWARRTTWSRWKRNWWTWTCPSSTARSWALWWRPRFRWAFWRPEWRGSYRDYPGGAPGFHGGAADTHGIGNNQCGSSFYGPAYGGGVSHHGVGAGVGQSCDATGYPSSVASVTLGRVLASAIV